MSVLEPERALAIADAIRPYCRRFRVVIRDGFEFEEGPVADVHIESDLQLNKAIPALHELGCTVFFNAESLTIYDTPSS